MENQFKVSITQHIQNMYDMALDSFIKADIELKQNPKSHLAKSEWRKCLGQVQPLEALLTHINYGWYDSEEYYAKHFNPNSKK
jgi:hypothetical protein